MRLYAIGVIMKKAGFTFEACLLQSYVTLLQTRCPSLLSSYCQDFNDVFWKATEDESFNFVKMMAPPVHHCLNCKQPLSLNNKPTKVTLFTLQGPIPSTKLRLRCSECAVQYGVCSFSDKSAEHLYPKSMRPPLVEASNVCYLEKGLYEWIPSFGYETLNFL